MSLDLSLAFISFASHYITYIDDDGIPRSGEVYSVYEDGTIYVKRLDFDSSTEVYKYEVTHMSKIVTGVHPVL